MALTLLDLEQISDLSDHTACIRRVVNPHRLTDASQTQPPRTGLMSRRPAKQTSHQCNLYLLLLVRARIHLLPQDLVECLAALGSHPLRVGDSS